MDESIAPIAGMEDARSEGTPEMGKEPGAKFFLTADQGQYTFSIK